VNSFPESVTRHRRGGDFNPGPSAPESSMLTTRLPSHPCIAHVLIGTDRIVMRVSVRLSVRQSVCPNDRPPHSAAAGLLLGARRTKDIG